MKERVKEISEIYGQKLIEYRRYLHQNAELSFKELKTAEWVRNRLTSIGIPLKEGIQGNSVVGILDSGKPGPNIAFRADMDALPIEEENDLPFRSQYPGVMHACGHDAHTATILCLAEAFTANKDILRGKVVFLFQQAEEQLPGGAKTLVEDGALDGVDMVFAFHVEANFPVGKVRICSGARTAAIGTYDIKITGKGGHGGFPHETIDPVSAACAIAEGVHQIISQRVDPIETAVLTVAYISAGKVGVPNIIPGSAVMGGNVRCLNNELRGDLIRMVQNLADGICKSRGCTYEFNALYGYPAVINTERETGFAAAAAKELGYENEPGAPSLGGEDFSYMLLERPGSFFFVGVCDPDDPETKAPHHNSRFKIDEKGMTVAFNILLETYFQIVGEGSKS